MEELTRLSGFLITETRLGKNERTCVCEAGNPAFFAKMFDYRCNIMIYQSFT
ncbi:MAG: hypothetical protein ACJAZY_003634 [Spirosomataceae bacterium]|jgi:hypothetical protein